MGHNTNSDGKYTVQIDEHPKQPKMYTEEEVKELVEGERKASLKLCADAEHLLNLEGDTMPSQASVANMLYGLIKSRSE